MTAREIFAVDETDDPDPGWVFYTIRPADVGKSVVQTEIGPVVVRDVIGRVQKIDVGKRLYWVPNNAGDWWFWQCENDAQRDKRLGVKS